MNPTFLEDRVDLDNQIYNTFRSCGLGDRLQKADLKRKFARADQLHETEQKIQMIAFDVTEHFVQTWQNIGFKGQLAAPSKYATIRYKQFFDDIGRIPAEVLISGPDTREDNETIYEELDQEAYELFLSDKKIRQEFYLRLNRFSRTMRIAFSTLEFIEKTDRHKVELYRRDLKFFQSLRVAVQRRYSDTVDYRQYEKQIQKLLDRHVSTEEVIRLTSQVNIFEREAFQKEVEAIEGVAARVDTIASRTARHISEKEKEDPVFYARFSALIQQAIDDFHNRRIDELQYLNRVRELSEKVVNYEDQAIPIALKSNPAAQEIDTIVDRHKVVDWIFKDDVINRMKHEIDDHLFKIGRDQGIEIALEVIDNIIERTIDIAKARS